MPVVAISADSAEDSIVLARKERIPFPLIHDVGLKAALAYGVAMDGEDIAVPAVFVIDGHGRIHWKQVGESLWDRPKVEDVLARVDEVR